MARVRSAGGGRLQIRLDQIDGPVMAQLQITPQADWETVSVSLSAAAKGIHNIYVFFSEGSPLEIDWIKFD
uniref:CAZy families CBM6/GH43 protein n=1 Tax=uncultured Paludibacter sp. TaxID=497635 RepID=A0A060BTB4_9BACT|nr:CAZy families CBM6/GH43 protein [uncultured Paludibacter sp.]